MMNTQVFATRPSTRTGAYTARTMLKMTPEQKAVLDEAARIGNACSSDVLREGIALWIEKHLGGADARNLLQ